MTIRLKRVYAAAASGDGYRVLVDRLWPRGISKADARIDNWCREAAPTTSLRKWFAHDRRKWRLFRYRYLQELESNPSSVNEIVCRADFETLTLLYAAKDETHNNAVILREFIYSLRERK